MSTPTILTETQGHVAIIKLNRPDKFHSFNREMALGLQAALDEAAADDNIRAILLTASGKAFCAGQDLGEAIDESGPGIEKIVQEHYNPIILRLRKIEKPIICAINGVAAGAGASIAIACDILVAGASATFIQAFSKIALIPDSGATFILPKLVGYQRAMALMMLGDKVSATEAFQMGMIYKVTEDDLLMETALGIAKQLSEMPTKALGLTKRLLNEGINNSLEQQLIREGQEQVVAAATADFKEGITAFMEKRKAVFTGK
ncbi:MAG: enoyl-CoA hydratase-related protein [Bacteroidota bacterium]|nr:enoyl-CoA hydratase-related protein [Bacteroidota bacterium]